MEKYSHVLGDWLAELGYTHCFMVAGGGCMHLIDGFRDRFTVVPVVHEITAGIATEHFNECSAGAKAFALVTTGPGFTNVVTAIAGCFVEHRQLLVVAGQVKSSDLLSPGIRQRGVQEIDGSGISRDITVHSSCLSEPISRAEFRRRVELSWDPHPGPVVIEVCLDVQAAPVDRAQLEVEGDETVTVSTDGVEQCVTRLRDEIAGAERPVILLGGLVERATARAVIGRLEALGVPLLTTTSAIDRVPSSSPVAAGRSGTWGGQRSANLVIAQADVAVAVGAQLDLQQTGFAVDDYAGSARLFQVFPSDAELQKPSPPLAAGFNADPNAVLKGLVEVADWSDRIGWSDYVATIRRLLPVHEAANQTSPGYVCPFELARCLSRATDPDDVIALCSSGGMFTSSLQVVDIAPGQTATVSPALASMGYGLGTAIGAAFARPGSRVVMVEGDGGFAQNLQDLATLVVNNLPIKMFVATNEGYGSIRATQRRFFGGSYVGCDTKTGLGFPDWKMLFEAYGIACRDLEPADCTEDRLREMISIPGPAAWIVPIDPEQTQWPSVSSRILPDGSMVSNPLSKMTPALTDDVAAQVERYLA